MTVLKGGLVGFAVSLVCLIIPGLHFVTGPLGPFFGGLIGGSQAEADLSRALGIGAVMGLLVAIPVVPVGLLFRDALASNLPGPLGSTAIYIIALVFPLYALSLGFYGALLGGHLVRRKRANTNVPRP